MSVANPGYSSDLVSVGARHDSHHIGHGEDSGATGHGSGCHGLHVFVGLLRLLTMMAQIAAKGFRDTMQRRFLCFSLFRHALDIIWVAGSLWIMSHLDQNMMPMERMMQMP